MKGKFLILAEYLTLLIYLLLYHTSDAFSITLIFKTLLMPLLLIFFFLNIRSLNVFIITISLALLFSTAGDLFMELYQKNNIYFLPGLTSFLLAHILYIFSFSYKLKLNRIKNKTLTLLFILLLLSSGLILYLWNSLAQMKFPVIIYALIITAVTYLAYLRCLQTYHKPCLLFYGALLFLLSDAILSIALFKGLFPFHREANMLFYVSGQLLITLGSIKISS